MADDAKTARAANRILAWAMTDQEVVTQAVQDMSRASLEALALELYWAHRPNPRGRLEDLRSIQSEINRVQAETIENLKAVSERKGDQTHPEGRRADADEADPQGHKEAVEPDEPG